MNRTIGVSTGIRGHVIYYRNYRLSFLSLHMLSANYSFPLRECRCRGTAPGCPNVLR